MNNNLPIENPPPFLVYVVRLIFLFVSKILWRIKFINTDKIPQNLPGGLLVISNHSTYFDPFWISLPIKRDLRYMAWDKAFEWFFVGFLIKNLGAFPVNTKFGSRKTFQQAVKLLKEGKTLMIFPEAVREFSDGKLLPFKIGAAKLALLADVPILPVTVRGANRVWAREMKFPRPAKVEIIFHPVLRIDEFEENISPEKLTEKIKEIIERGTLLKK
ncbi:MAG: lysophospholipid acyltransferase family protein [Pyrinomonadaceae bacterium]